MDGLLFLLHSETASEDISQRKELACTFHAQLTPSQKPNLGHTQEALGSWRHCKEFEDQESQGVCPYEIGAHSQVSVCLLETNGQNSPCPQAQVPPAGGAEAWGLNEVPGRSKPR